MKKPTLKSSEAIQLAREFTLEALKAGLFPLNADAATSAKNVVLFFETTYDALDSDKEQQ